MMKGNDFRIRRVTNVVVDYNILAETMKKDVRKYKQLVY